MFRSCRIFIKCSTESYLIETSIIVTSLIYDRLYVPSTSVYIICQLMLDPLIRIRFIGNVSIRRG